jgi:hypothetical protein
MCTLILRSTWTEGISMEEIRLEALKGLTILAIHDDQFRRGVMADLDSTLRRYGYDLTGPEMERLRDAHRQIAGMSDEDLARELSERQQRVRVLSEEEGRILAPGEYVSAAWH